MRLKDMGDHRVDCWDRFSVFRSLQYISNVPTSRPRLCRLCLFHPHELNHDVDYEGLMYGSRRVSVEEYMFYGGMVRVAWARESGDGGG